jgi:hypothetical protein
MRRGWPSQPKQGAGKAAQKQLKHVNAPATTTNITGTTSQVGAATRLLRLHISQHGHYSNLHKGDVINAFSELSALLHAALRARAVTDGG